MEVLLVEGEVLPTQGITDLIQQVREVPAMKSTTVEKILQAKRATRYKAMKGQHNKKRATP